MSEVETFEGLTPIGLLGLLEDFGATVHPVKAVGATVEEAILNALKDNVRTVATFGVRWHIPVQKVDKVTGQVRTVMMDVGHRMMAMRDASTGALKIFDRSATWAYESLEALERVGYTGISAAKRARTPSSWSRTRQS